MEEITAQTSKLLKALQQFMLVKTGAQDISETTNNFFNNPATNIN